MSTRLKLVCIAACAAAPAFTRAQSASNEGYVTTADGVRLSYSVVGSGSQTVIVPGRLFLLRGLSPLAAGRRLIFYDTRGRGKSDPVHDPKRETIGDDVRDLEAVRAHFGAGKTSVIGYSYMGLLVMLYTLEHPDRVERAVQLGPVPMRFDARYPPALSESYAAAVDLAGVKRLDSLRTSGFDRSHPREYCEADWEVNRVALVGDPAHAGRLSVTKSELCAMPNEWQVNQTPHFQAMFASIQLLGLDSAGVRGVTMPVLTVHGTRDRNAPYGGGREWAMRLPNARLVSVKGAAHQSFDEFPEIVLPAIDAFLRGNWPPSAERVTSIVPAP
ncbi:MAG TPA: alpha/beta hydrolase [Gemmatimonadaceae bacterium]|nr:alpha/beta hydrolase [Gemmatimonadaceae bacterium]